MKRWSGWEFFGWRWKRKESHIEWGKQSKGESFSVEARGSGSSSSISWIPSSAFPPFPWHRKRASSIVWKKKTTTSQSTYLKKKRGVAWEFELDWQIKKMRIVITDGKCQPSASNQWSVQDGERVHSFLSLGVQANKLEKKLISSARNGLRLHWLSWYSRKYSDLLILFSYSFKQIHPRGVGKPNNKIEWVEEF